MNTTKRSIHLGFSGTRSGLTTLQRTRLLEVLYKSLATHAHHGGAQGADEDFHAMVRWALPHTYVVVHPCQGVNHTYYLDDPKVTVLPGRPPLKRNREMVAAVERMIICPAQDREILRSGTWATYRYAKAARRTRYILFPTIAPTIEDKTK
jgi:hypothetical protein